MRHQYTRAELESITQETAIFLGRDSMWMSSRIG